MVSANTLRRRVGDFEVNDWIMDSGAFTQVVMQGGFQQTPEEYADHIHRWRSCGNLLAAVTQDYMCEDVALEATGLSLQDHQRLTVKRYRKIRQLVDPDVYVMPVLQGFAPEEYVACLYLYGDSIPDGSWVGVGSVCKRNTSVAEIEDVLGAIKSSRPDLRLHGFGIKLTALTSAFVYDSLYSSDSMAWSYAARREGRDSNDWREAKMYSAKVARLPQQLDLLR